MIGLVSGSEGAPLTLWDTNFHRKPIIKSDDKIVLLGVKVYDYNEMLQIGMRSSAILDITRTTEPEEIQITAEPEESHESTIEEEL